MTAQYALKCLIPESNPRALPLWMSTLPESGCKDNKKSRLCKRTTAYILYLVRCIFLSHRLFPKLRPSEDSLFCCFGAEDEARTRDPNLGKVVLYQLSYFRIFPFGIAKVRRNLKPPNIFCKKRIKFSLFSKNTPGVAQNTPFFVLNPLIFLLLSTKTPRFCAKHYPSMAFQHKTPPFLC